MKEKKIAIAILDNAESGLGYYANFIGSLFTCFLPEIYFAKTQKIVIEFREQESVEIYPEMSVIGVYTILKTLDFKRFKNSDPLKKTEFLSLEVYECLKTLFRKFNIGLANLEFAYEQIKRSNYRLVKTICGGPKENKKGSVAATVIAEHFLEYALLSTSFYFKDNDVSEVFLMCKSDPASFIYSQLFSSTKWDDDNTFRISNKKKEINIIVTISGAISVLYNPGDNNSDRLKEEIKYLTQEVYFKL